MPGRVRSRRSASSCGTHGALERLGHPGGGHDGARRPTCILSHSRDGIVRRGRPPAAPTAAARPGSRRALAVPVHEHPESRERLLPGHPLLEDRGHQRLHDQCRCVPAASGSAGATPRPAGCGARSRSRRRRRPAGPAPSLRPPRSRPPGLGVHLALARPRLDPERRGALRVRRPASAPHGRRCVGSPPPRRQAQDRGDRTGPPGTPGARLGGGAAHSLTLTHARIAAELGGVARDAAPMSVALVRTARRPTSSPRCGHGHPVPQGQGRRDRRPAGLGGARGDRDRHYLGGTLRQRRTGLGWRGVSALPPPTPPRSPCSACTRLRRDRRARWSGSQAARAAAAAELLEATADEQAGCAVRRRRGAPGRPRRAGPEAVAAAAGAASVRRAAMLALHHAGRSPR